MKHTAVIVGLDPMIRYLKRWIPDRVGNDAMEFTGITEKMNNER